MSRYARSPNASAYRETRSGATSALARFCRLIPNARARASSTDSPRSSPSGSTQRPSDRVSNARTLKQIHADLSELGFTGSYDRVAAFARRWRQEQQEHARTAGRSTFVPLTFALGEAFQFDWSEDWAVINGERTKLQVAQFKLSHSRAFFLRAYLLQTHEMLFDAHHHAFVAWGGIPRRGIYDNMKTAVDKVRRGKLWASTRALAPWSATTCLMLSSATRRPAGRRLLPIRGQPSN